MPKDQLHPGIGCVGNSKWNDIVLSAFQKEQPLSTKQRNEDPKRHTWDINRAEFVDSNGDRWAVYMQFKTVKGRISPVALLIEPLVGVAELTTEILHELSIQKIVRPWVKREQVMLAQRNANNQVRAHSGRPHSDDELQSVASVYRIAYAKSLPVQQTVADTLGIPLSTAAKRIMAARRRGLIPRSVNRRRSV
jgi:hypothetical protein